MYLCYMFANIVINLPCPRAYEPPLCQIELQQLHFLSHSFRHLIHLNASCSLLSAIALLLFHYFLRYSPPLSSFLSAECCVAHRRVLCYSSPLVVILHRLLCHTPSCSSDIPHTYAIKLWVKNLTLTTIIQYLFYIRSSKENWPNVKKIPMKNNWRSEKDLLQFFYKRSQFFIFFGFRFCFTFLASHNRSNLASTVEETSTALQIRKKNFRVSHLAHFSENKFALLVQQIEKMVLRRRRLTFLYPQINASQTITLHWRIDRGWRSWEDV